MYYFLLIVYITVIAYFIKFNSQNKKNISLFLILSFIAIGIMIGFRSVWVGADTQAYYNSYIEFSNQKLGFGLKYVELEPGYVILIQALNYISPDPQTMFIFEAILVCITYGLFIYLNVSDVFEAYVAILGYLAFNIFSFQLTGYRQAIAMCICLLAYEFIKKKKIVPFILCVALGAQFHASAWLFVAAYAICVSKSSRGKLAAVGVATIAIVTNIGYFNNLIASVSERYSKYGIEDANNGYIFWFIMMLILAFTEIYKEKILTNNGNSPDIEILYNVNYIVCLLWTVRLFTRTAERPSFFFLPATFILMAKLSNTGFLVAGKKNVTKILLCTMLILFFFYRYIKVPYSFVF